MEDTKETNMKEMIILLDMMEKELKRENPMK